MTRYIQQAPVTSLSPSAKPARGFDDDEEDMGGDTPVFSFYEQHVVNSVTHVYISKPIIEPAAYIPLIQFLNSRQQGDEVHIHFNCPGGSLSSGIQLVTATQNCQATVVGHLDSMAYSMAAIWFLSCDMHYVSPFGTLMFHVYAGGGGGGKAPDQKASQVAVDTTYADLLNTVCNPFLTKREVVDITENSRDLYFHHDTILDRLEGKHLQKKKASAKKAPAKKSTPTAASETETKGSVLEG